MSRRRVDQEEVALDIVNSSLQLAIGMVPKDQRAHREMRKDWAEIRERLTALRGTINATIKRMATVKR